MVPFEQWGGFRQNHAKFQQFTLLSLLYNSASHRNHLLQIIIFNYHIHYWSNILWKSIVVIVNQRNWVFATNSDFLISISLQLNIVYIWYFKLWIMLDQIIKLWNIKGFNHQVVKIQKVNNLSLLQKLSSFPLFKWKVTWN